MGCCVVCDGPGANVCGTRKAAQREAARALLERVYPSRRFGELAAAPVEAGVAPRRRAALRRELAAGLEAPVYLAAADPAAGDLCDLLHVLCVGREPCLLPLTLPGGEGAPHPPAPARDLYLRVALSSLGPFAAVQEVEVRLDPAPGAAVAGAEAAPALRLRQRARAGVYDELLLPRYRRLVDLLDRAGLRHLDFDVLLEEPAGFDGAAYRERYGAAPTLLSYLFSPRPAIYEATEYL